MLRFSTSFARTVPLLKPGLNFRASARRFFASSKSTETPRSKPWLFLGIAGASIFGLFLTLTPSENQSERKPIRFIKLETLKSRPLEAGFPRFPQDQALCVNLDDVDLANSFIVFLSHNWLRGSSVCLGWDSVVGNHPDDSQHRKFALTVAGVEKAWRALAPNMKECYIWVDYSCIDQDGNPAAEVQDNLHLIMRASDCIFTPIPDPEWERWGSDLRIVKNWFEDYKAPVWVDGKYAYLNRAWCRLEMLLAANLDLREDEQRSEKFAGGLKIAAKRNYRPHLLYGTRENQRAGAQPIIVGPLQDSFADTHSPRTGEVGYEEDRPKLEKLMAVLTVRRKKWGYEGGLNDQGQRHGQGRMTWANGDVYDGQWKNDQRHCFGVAKFADLGEYSGEFKNDLKHGMGKFKWGGDDRYFYYGQWLNDKMHGEGLAMVPSSEGGDNFVQIKGTFANGELISRG